MQRNQQASTLRRKKQIMEINRKAKTQVYHKNGKKINNPKISNWTKEEMNKLRECV